MTRATAEFGAQAGSYDALRRIMVPCFDDFYGAVLDILADWRPEGPKTVLDLGAGTGLLAAMVGARFPGADLTLLDGAEPMLEKARARFEDRPGTRVLVGEMETADIGTGNDAIVSALAIHHLVDEDKRTLFARIHDALVPGGIFINAEQVAGPTEAADARYHRLWLETIKARGATEADIAAAAERMAFDRCSPLADQLAWLTDAGFVDVDAPYKSWRFAVYCGRKAA